MKSEKKLDAQLHIMVNSPAKFYDCVSFTCRVMCDTKLHAECIILKHIIGFNSGLIRHGQKENSRCTTTHDGKHTCDCS
jgi:hypothetical protein